MGDDERCDPSSEDLAESDKWSCSFVDAVNLVGLRWSIVNCNGMVVCEVLFMGEVCEDWSGDEAAWMESWSSCVCALVNISGDVL